MQTFRIRRLETLAEICQVENRNKMSVNVNPIPILQLT